MNTRHTLLVNRMNGHLKPFTPWIDNQKTAKEYSHQVLSRKHSQSAAQETRNGIKKLLAQKPVCRWQPRYIVIPEIATWLGNSASLSAAEGCTASSLGMWLWEEGGGGSLRSCQPYFLEMVMKKKHPRFFFDIMMLKLIVYLSRYVISIGRVHTLFGTSNSMTFHDFP